MFNNSISYQVGSIMIMYLISKFKIDLDVYLNVLSISNAERITVLRFFTKHNWLTYVIYMSEMRHYYIKKNPADYVSSLSQLLNSTHNLTLRALFTEPESNWHDKDKVYLSDWSVGPAPYHLISRECLMTLLKHFRW